jgi:hypothetical protein
MTKNLIGFFGGAALIFLLFSFGNVTMSIQYWSQEARTMCAICMLLGGALGVLAATHP